MSRIPSPALDLMDDVGYPHFDGNLSDGVTSWWFIEDHGYEPDEVASSMKALLGCAVDENFSFLVLPIDGFRV